VVPKAHDKQMLSRLQLFRNVNLDDPAIENLLENCSYREIANGEPLLSTEKENRFLYVVVSGRCAIILGQDEEVPLTTVDPGECVGEMSIIDSRVPSAEVSATEPTIVLEIEQETLWLMVTASHEVARNLLYIMSERVRYSNLVIADTMEMQRKYQRYATIDALTGLHNRGWLDDMFSREIKRTERDQLPLCLIMIDVDNFKDFNDVHGHLAGDRALIKVGESIRSPLRPNDLVARFGGEEFSVLLPETTLEHAKVVAERLREKVESTDLGSFDGVDLPGVTISLGIAEYEVGFELETIIAAADVAMYHAKRGGRNRIEIAAKS
jgi:diguanylate cyclase (GGDEF)-like protein